MRKNRNKKYNPQKLQTMRTQGKVSRSVPLTTLTPDQVALKIKAKQIIKRNSFPAIRDQREGCKFAGWMDISMNTNNLADTVAMRCGDSVVLVTNGKLPQGFKWQAYKGKKNRMRIVKEMELSA